MRIGPRKAAGSVACDICPLLYTMTGRSEEKANVAEVCKPVARRLVVGTGRMTSTVVVLRERRSRRALMEGETPAAAGADERVTGNDEAVTIGAPGARLRRHLATSTATTWLRS